MRMKGSYRMSVGVSSMLMIFIVLSLTTFSVLSFVTANTDKKWTDKALTNVQRNYAAYSEVQTTMKKLDEKLYDYAAIAGKGKAALAELEDELKAQVTPVANNRDKAYAILARAAADTAVRGAVVTDTDTHITVAYTLLMAEHFELQVEFSISKIPQGRRVILAKQIAANTAPIDDEEDTMQLNPFT